MKFKTISLAVFLAAPSIWAVNVTLQSNDSKTFKVPLEVAKRSETLKGLIQDVDDNTGFIPLSIMDAKTLGRAIAIMRWLASNPRQDFAPYLDKNWKPFSTSELVDVIGAIHFLDVQPHDVLNTALKFYGERIFGDVELAKLGTIKTSESYAIYEKQNLALPSVLQKIVISQSLQSIDRIFLDKSPDRRINAIAQTPLDVAQVIAYIAKNQTESADKLPKIMLEVLEEWQGKDFAKKIHFGPWPTEFATWPSHCPLQSNKSYNMYSDGTPDDRYINNGDGTVTDICTKLTWEQTPSVAGVVQQAKDRCNAKGWHLPTLIELQTLLNYEVEAPALNGIFKEGNVTFLSSTSKFDYQKYVWTIDFRSGVVKSTDMNGRVRCVRGETGGSQTFGAQDHYSYFENGETVTDNFTGAVWQRQSVNEKKSRAEAREYCANLKQDGKRWLLPTVKQLSTLLDVGVDAPKIDKAAFPQVLGPKQEFWSNSVKADDRTLAWTVNFHLGIPGSHHIDLDSRVRCVR